MGSALGRLSFMTLIYRFFGTTNYRRQFIIFLMVETIVINLVTAITIFTQCPDVRTLWDAGSDFPGTCWSPLVQEYTRFFQGCKIFQGIWKQKFLMRSPSQLATRQPTLHWLFFLVISSGIFRWTRRQRLVWRRWWFSVYGESLGFS